MHRFQTRALLCMAIATPPLANSSSPGAQITPITIALSGQPSPIAAFNFGASFSPPTISGGGAVAFLGTLPAAPVGSRGLLVAGGPGSLEPVARQNSLAAGTLGDVRYTAFDPSWPIAISDTGTVAFAAALHGMDARGPTDQGIWTGAPGNLHVHARFGDIAAEAAPATYQQLRPPRLSSGGQVAFSGILQGPGINAANDEAAWSGFPGGLFRVLAEGANAAGFAGLTYDSIAAGVGVAPRVNPAGLVAARMALAGPGVDASNRIAIWAGTPLTLSPIARTGDQAANAPLGQTYAALADPTIDAAGRVVYRGSVTEPAGDPQQAVWQSSINGAGPVIMVAREGDHTGVLPGVTFAGFDSPVAAGNGAVAFRSRLLGAGVLPANNEASLFGQPGQLQLAGRKGAGAPGLAPGITFKSLDVPVINNHGAGLFMAELMGPGIGDDNDEGIWGFDPALGAFPIIREGDTMVVAPGDVRTVSILTIWDGTHQFAGLGSGWNDAGQLAFVASFTDNSAGVFLLKVPEPATVLLALAGVAFLRRRLGPSALE